MSTHQATSKHKSDESGVMRYPLVQDIALLLVIALTVWAAVSSQYATNDVQNTQRRLDRISTCNQEYLSKTISALNQRTSYFQAQSDANVKLQKAQSSYIAIFFQQPPPGTPAAVAALKQYFKALTEYLQVSDKSSKKARDNPFPTNRDLKTCLNPK